LTAVVAVGDNVVDMYPSLGRLFPGGNAVNVAVAVRRSGVEAAYAGVVGTDDAGAAIRSALEAEDVLTDRLRTKEGPTASCVVELAAGDRIFVDGDLGVSRFRLDEADLEYLSGFDCIHTGECSGTEDQLEELAGVSRISFDFSDRPFDYCAPLLDKVWLASFSGHNLDSGKVSALADRALRGGAEIVLVTRGADGACLFTVSGAAIQVKAEPIVPVDTLGAGDAVIGSVLAGLLREQDLESVMQSAMTLAAEVCQHHGAFGYGRALPE
jgi:fructoselysine 6-kinase